MKVLVIGSGGREHALAWKLRQSPRVTEIFCAPGNAGTGAIAKNVPVKSADLHELVKFALSEKIGLTVVGPDDVLAAGAADLFQQNGLRIFGPAQAAARLESSKVFAKQFMQRHGIPTACSGSFSDSADAHRFCQAMRYPVVIKADGLALGKGVIIAQHPQEAAAAIHRIMELRQFGDAGSRVVIEEFLTGQECSIHALIDGKNFLLFPGAQDHKRAFDNDSGPNTGGMGTFSPSGLLTAEMRERVVREIMQPFMSGLRDDGIRFQGLLFPGLMVTSDGPRVLEFNCRFGDPETQVLLPRLRTDLLDLLDATIDGSLDRCEVSWDDRAAVCVIMASGGYPGNYATGKVIAGIDEFRERDDVMIFHAGTKIENNRVVTAGGRVLGVTALASDLRSARDKAYDAVARIRFEGCHYRTDIALKGLAS
jgi:phosphoribosylamine--glycine ligase